VFAATGDVTVGASFTAATVTFTTTSTSGAMPSLTLMMKLSLPLKFRTGV
jgi:hypothetical protein